MKQGTESESCPIALSQLYLVTIGSIYFHKGLIKKGLWSSSKLVRIKKMVGRSLKGHSFFLSLSRSVEKTELHLCQPKAHRKEFKLLTSRGAWEGE